MYPSRWNQGLFLIDSASLPFLEHQLFKPVLWNLGEVVEVGVRSLQEMGGAGKDFCAQEPHSVLSVSMLLLGESGLISNLRAHKVFSERVNLVTKPRRYFPM